MLCLLFSPALFNKFYIADDLGSFTIPLRHLYAEGLHAGRVDLWCQALFGGFYMHGEGQMGMFHPLHLFLYRFMPFVQAFNLEQLAIYLALFVGSYVLFYKWVRGRLAASFGAFVFSFGGTNLMQIVHTNQIAIIAHAPWLMIALDRCIRGDKRYRTRWCLVVALLNGSELLLGHPYFFLMSLALQVWYVLYLTGRSHWGSGVLRAAVGTALGILIGAVQLIPTWSALAMSTRARPSFEFLSFGSLHPINFLQWLNPYIFMGRKVGSLGPHELCIYAGIGPLLLFVWLCTRKNDPDRRLILFLVTLALVGIFLSLGKYDRLFAFYAQLPGLNIFRVPARYMLFVNFAFAGVSALALKRLRSVPPDNPSRLCLLLMAGLFTLSLSTVGMKAVLYLMGNEHRFLLSPASHVVAGSLIVCTGIALFWFALHSQSWALTAFWVFAICDMTFYSGTYLRTLPTGGMHYYEAEVPPVAVPGPISSYPRNDDKLTLGGYRLAGGYAGLEPKTVLPVRDPKYLQALGVTALQDARGTWLLPSISMAPIRLARPFHTEHPVEAMDHVDLTQMAVITRELAVDPAASGFVHIVAEYPGFVRIVGQTSGPALCVLAQRLHPGWSARIGGDKLPLFAVDGDLTGFVLPGGNQDVILEFHPKDFVLGRNITLGTLAVVVLALFSNLIVVSSRGENQSAREASSAPVRWWNATSRTMSWL
jgi:hypothetical protein